AGVDAGTAIEWRKDQRAANALALILGRSGRIPQVPPEGIAPERWEAMRKYARAAALSAACKRAGTTTAAYYHALKDAEQAEAREDLENYLSYRLPYGRSFARACGLLSKHLFIPSAQ